MNRASSAMGLDYIRTASVEEIPEITAAVTARLQTLYQNGTEQDKKDLSNIAALMASYLKNNLK